MISFDTFTAIDLETTGLDSKSCEIIEIGAARFDRGELKETYSQLVKPSVSIPPEIVRLTGIDDGAVARAPSIDSVMGVFPDFLSDSPWIIGHNIDFDLGFLRAHLSGDVMTDLEKRALDTAVLSRMLFPQLHRYSLGALVKHFKVKRERAHRALNDCLATAGVYLVAVRHLAGLSVSSREQVGRVLFGSRDMDLFRKSLEPVVPSVVIDSVEPSEAETGEETFPDNVKGESPPESYEDYIEVDETAVENHFLPGGVLSKAIDRYEYREAQASMAIDVARAFNRSEIHVIEAPTGVGKSLAYLLPASWWASLNRERIIISTQTRNLQSQLFYKDIPQIQGAAGFKFKAVLLKGRGNYLCLYKYHELLAEAEATFEKRDRAALAPVILWAKSTRAGDISECHGFNPGANLYIWSRISCEGSFCLGQACGFAKECFLLRVKREASSAQVVIANHYLTFADFASGGDLIRETGNVIFDEAHNLEKIAATYLGEKFEKRALDGMLAELYSSRPTQSGFLIKLKFELSKVAIDEKMAGSVDKVIDSIVGLLQASSDFFEKLSANLKNTGMKSDGKEIRIASGMNPCDSDEREELIAAFDKLSGRLDDLIDLVREYDELSEKRERVVRLEAFAGDLKGFRDKAFKLTYLEDPDSVYWIETPFSARFAPSIVSAPLEVGKLLNEKFYDYLKTGILTSATLAVKGDFAYFMERLGLDLGSKERTVSLLLESPFDLNSEVAIITAGFLPSPKNREFESSAIETLKLLLTAGAGKAMVLFTSHSSLGNAADQLNEILESTGIELFRQRGTYNSEAILNRFKSAHKAVLFGTDTFWEGVDLPGPLLELLVLFRLPFTVPDRPWFKANLEKIESDGQSAFARLSLPDAVVKFRQGFGRLIRTADDRGCVVILDSRVDKTSFGPTFIKSVRGAKFKPTTPLETAEIIRKWLNRD